MTHDLKAIVRDGNKAKFSHYRDGKFFYVVKVQETERCGISLRGNS